SVNTDRVLKEALLEFPRTFELQSDLLRHHEAEDRHVLVRNEHDDVVRIVRPFDVSTNRRVQVFVTAVEPINQLQVRAPEAYFDRHLNARKGRLLVARDFERVKRRLIDGYLEDAIIAVSRGRAECREGFKSEGVSNQPARERFAPLTDERCWLHLL